MKCAYLLPGEHTKRLMYRRSPPTYHNAHTTSGGWSMVSWQRATFKPRTQFLQYTQKEG